MLLKPQTTNSHITMTLFFFFKKSKIVKLDFFAVFYILHVCTHTQTHFLRKYISELSCLNLAKGIDEYFYFYHSISTH